jgi:hypothetical protein
MQTRRQVCELIQRRLAGGDVSDDFHVKLAEINLWLNHGIAAAAMKNYTDGVQVDGIEYVSDSFYVSFRDVTITHDTGTGYYYADLPAMPYGLPKGYDITRLAIQGNGELSKGLIRVDATKNAAYQHLPKPKNKLFYWMEGKRVWIDSFTALQTNKLFGRMAASDTSTYSGGLDDPFNAPPDYVPFIMDYVYAKFIQPVPQDTSNDGISRV